MDSLVSDQLLAIIGSIVLAFFLWLWVDTWLAHKKREKAKARKEHTECSDSLVKAINVFHAYPTQPPAPPILEELSGRTGNTDEYIAWLDAELKQYDPPVEIDVFEETQQLSKEVQDLKAQMDFAQRQIEEMFGVYGNKTPKSEKRISRDDFYAIFNDSLL